MKGNPTTWSQSTYQSEGSGAKPGLEDESAMHQPLSRPTLYHTRPSAPRRFSCSVQGLPSPTKGPFSSTEESLLTLEVGRLVRPSYSLNQPQEAQGLLG